MKFKQIPMKVISDDKEFYRGERFRIYNVGLNSYGATNEQDYFDYMLVESDIPSFMLINISGEFTNQKAGIILCYVNKLKNVGRVVTSAREIKSKLGIEDTYWLTEQKNGS